MQMGNRLVVSRGHGEGEDEGEVSAAVQGQPECLCGPEVLCVNCFNVSFLVVILYYTFVRRCLWRKLIKGT